MIEQGQQKHQQLQHSALERFKQQTLQAWYPVSTLTKSIITFLLLSLIFLGLGIPMLVLSNTIHQYSIRYDDDCVSYGTTCTLNFQVPTTMTAPVFVYYELKNFYQNHRLYSRSKSTQQLKGNSRTQSQIQSQCDPIVYNKDIHATTSITGKTLNPFAFANPCGMIALTLFNDSFSLGSSIAITDQGISWPGDSERYSMPDPDVMWTNITNQRFMNWMRIASSPQFKKLWGKIEDDLIAGNYTLTIQNSNFDLIIDYDMSAFHGQKYFIVSQANFFGAHNNFLSIAYIAAGSIFFIFSIAFLIRKNLSSSKMIVPRPND